jgi:hypothetical protein
VTLEDEEKGREEEEEVESTDEPTTEEKRLQELDEKIDSASAESLVDEYRRSDPVRPVWRLIEDIQSQAMVYTNIIEQLKEGTEATEVKKRFENLGLVKPGTLPNPLARRLIGRARSRLEKYRKALIDIVRDFGEDLLREELRFGAETTAVIQVNIGLPLQVTLGAELTATLN